MRKVTVLLMASVLVLATGCESIQNAIYKSAIEKALHEDALTGKDSTTGHTAAMRQVDLSNCPQDFRVAYMNHIHAWEESAQVNEAKTKLNNEDDTAAIAGVLATLFDSDATPWSDHLQAQQELKRLDAVASNDIKSTWLEVETIASKYGAKLPE